MNGHKIRDQNGLYFLTMTVVGWIDVFTRIQYRNLLIESLDYCRKEKELQIYAYVIMSNHVHVIVKTDHKSGLSNIIRDFKNTLPKTSLML